MKPTYEQLEQQLAAAGKTIEKLAAENVVIRENSEEVYAAGYNHGHLNTVDGIAYAGCVKDDFYGLALQILAEADTPATDAVLAEIRAQELDSLAGVAETMLVKFSNQQCSSDMHDVVGWKMVLQQAVNRAAKLREGADKC